VQATLGYDNATNTPIPSVVLESEEIPYQDAQVVGLEVSYVENIDGTRPHILLLEDYKVKGGSTLFVQEDTIPAWNYLGDAKEFTTQTVAGLFRTRPGGGFGIHKQPALRAYPHLDPTNRIQLLVSVANKMDSAGVVGLAGGGDQFSYIQAWALVNRLSDDVYGAPGAQISAMLEALN